MNRKIISFFIIISFLIPLTMFNSMELVPSSYNGNYTIKPEESNNYIVIKYIDNQLGSRSFLFPLENSTLMRYKMSKGVKFTVIVVDHNKSTTGVDQYFIRENISIPSLGSFTSSIVNETYPTINPAFNSGTNAYTYYSDLFKNQNISLQQKNNEIIINQTVSDNRFRSFTSITIINWKTGWLDSYEEKDYFSNGTVFFDYKYETIRPSMNFLTYVSDFIIIFLIAIVVVTIVILSVSYREYMKLSPKELNKGSYFEYLKDKIQMNKKMNNANPGMKVDKALEKIEEIIDENQS